MAGLTDLAEGRVHSSHGALRAFARWGALALSVLAAVLVSGFMQEPVAEEVKPP